MNKTGRIEDNTYRGTIFVLLADGKVFGFNSGKYDIETFVGTVAQGNAFYDRESAELAAQQRAAQVNIERLLDKGSSMLFKPVDSVEKEMGEDMEYLK